jgi:site-specific DNA recombinase
MDQIPPPAADRKVAILYARVSSAKQAEAELPIESQIEAGRLRAEEMQADLAKVFIDSGRSGRDWQRPEFLAAMEYCTTRKVDYFICWSSSRFGRGRLDAGLHKRALAKAGTRVVFVTCDPGVGPTAYQVEAFQELVDEMYSRNVSADTIRSQQKNARDGHWNGGAVPYGYRVEPAGKRKRLAVDEHEAAVVREIFETYMAGHGAKSLALELNKRGCLRRGKPWSKTTMLNLLTNRVYTGVIVFGRRESITGLVRPESEWIVTPSHPAIVSDDEFAAVQTTLGQRAPVIGTGSPLSGFVFTGLLRCGCCGQGLQIESATSRSGKVYRYYNCRSAQKGTGCKHRRLPARKIDALLCEAIVERVLNRDHVEAVAHELHELRGRWIEERAAQRKGLVGQLRDAERRRGKVYEVLELHGRDAPNLGDLTTRLRELNERVRTLERQISALDEAPPPTMRADPIEIDALREHLKAILLDRMDEPERAKQLRLYFEDFILEVTVQADHLEIRYRPDRLLTIPGNPGVHSNVRWLPELDSNQRPAD